MRKLRWWRAAQWMLGLGVVALAVRALSRNWEQLVAQQVAWRFQPFWVIAALSVMLLSYALQIEAWRRVVAALGHRLRWSQAARVCTVSNLGKYIPGKVWAIAGAAMLAQREGVSGGAAVAAAILLQGLALASGVAVSAFLAPELLTGLAPATRIGVVVIGVLAVLGSFGLGVPAMRGMLQRSLPASAPALPAIDIRVLAAALVVNAAVWGMTGLSFVWLARGVVADPGLSWALATAVFTLAYVAGLVAVFAPGGVGVRESLVVLLLQAAIGYKLALALALASRVLLTCTELGAALPFLVGTGRASLTSNDPGTR